MQLTYLDRQGDRQTGFLCPQDRENTLADSSFHLKRIAIQSDMHRGTLADGCVSSDRRTDRQTDW